MSSEIIPSEQCKTMADVRAGVDHLDRELVRMLALRFGYMQAAARIKPDRQAVRDEARKAEVIAHVRAAAAAQHVPEELVAQLWDVLVEGSIAFELECWDAQRGNP